MRQLEIKKQLTNRAILSLDKYLLEIARVPLIDSEEETLLAERIQSGDDEALEKLVRANLRFVVSVAKQYQNKGLDLSDLINEGNLGLIAAAQRFDTTRGFRFISYAVWWIRQTILKALAEQARIIRLPLSKIGELTRINRTFAKLEQTYEREPTPNEIAELLEMYPEDVKDSLKTNLRQVSMDTPVSDDENNTMCEILPNNDTPSPDSNLIDESLKYEIANVLHKLEPSEAKVIELYFGLGKEEPLSLDDIGQKMRLSGGRVGQIKIEAIKKMQQITRCKILKTYLG